MATISRRRFHLFCLASVVSADGLARRLAAAGRRERAFTLDLRGSSIGVHVNQSEAVELAFRHGFESLTPSPTELAELTAAQRTALLERMQACRLVWGSAGLPVEFRRDQSTFDSGLRELPRLAKALEAAGVTRMGTYLRPYHDQLSYHSNFRQHTERLRACAKILHDHGLRFGLEYVGPKTLWASSRHSFIHTMAETRELITAINVPNMGLVLDSWHWYTSHETADDLRSLTNRDIVACDLNDANRQSTRVADGDRRD